MYISAHTHTHDVDSHLLCMWCVRVHTLLNHTGLSAGVEVLSGSPHLYHCSYHSNTHTRVHVRVLFLSVNSRSHFSEMTSSLWWNSQRFFFFFLELYKTEQQGWAESPCRDPCITCREIYRHFRNRDRASFISVLVKLVVCCQTQAKIPASKFQSAVTTLCLKPRSQNSMKGSQSIK